MDTLPSKDQGIAASPTSPEPVEGIADTPTRSEPPRYEDDDDVPPIRRKSGGFSVLLIVLLVLGVLGLVGLVVAGGFIALGFLFFSVQTAPMPAPAASPAQVQPAPNPVLPDKGPERAPPKGNKQP